MTKKKEYVYIFNQYHCNDRKHSWCEHEPIRMVEKEVFDKTMKKYNEHIEKNYKTTDGVWYVKK